MKSANGPPSDGNDVVNLVHYAGFLCESIGFYINLMDFIPISPGRHRLLSSYLCASFIFPFLGFVVHSPRARFFIVALPMLCVTSPGFSVEFVSVSLRVPPPTHSCRLDMTRHLSVRRFVQLEAFNASASANISFRHMAAFTRLVRPIPSNSRFHLSLTACGLTLRNRQCRASYRNNCHHH